MYKCSIDVDKYGDYVIDVLQLNIRNISLVFQDIRIYIYKGKDTEKKKYVITNITKDRERCVKMYTYWI